MKLLLGNCLGQMKTLADSSVDSIVTDPPYGLSFMGKAWDYEVPSEEIWREAFRVLKPGGHLLSFFGTRTYHRGVIKIEDAGFEIRDQIQWNYGSGFPKSHNVYKAALKDGLCCGCDVKSGHENSSDMRSLSEETPQAGVLDQKNNNIDLQLSVQRNTPGSGLEKARPQRSASLDCGKPKILSEENVRIEQSSLEGRSHLQKKQGQLHRPEICEMSEGISGNEPERRLRNGASTSNSNAPKALSNSDRGSSSQRSQHKKQSSEQSRALADESVTQTSGAWPRCPSCKLPILDQGLGTALKPANEPIVVARKPLEKGLTVAENVLKYGTGAINVDASRIATETPRPCRIKTASLPSNGKYGEGLNGSLAVDDTVQGRFPANIIFDESAAELLDAQTQHLHGAGSVRGKGKAIQTNDGAMFGIGNHEGNGMRFGDSGGASRFFYVAKASKSERNKGLEGIVNTKQGARPKSADASGKFPDHDHRETGGNNHPTVKPIKLMEYLIKLVTPPNGTVLDPFMGSGSTGVAAKQLGFKFIGCEMSKEYMQIAEKRIMAAV